MTFSKVMVEARVVLADPLAWLRLCAEHGVTRTWAPNFGFELVAAAGGEVPDVSCVRTWINAGEQVPPATRRFFARWTHVA